MSQPPTGSPGFPPQPPAGDALYGATYGATQQMPQQHAGAGAPPTAPFGGPVSAPPTFGAPAEQPMSAPPIHGAPMSGPPMSGPPMYGSPMSGSPMSGPPMYGSPMSGPPYGVPAARTGRSVLVLAVVAGLLFVLGGVMTGLFLNTSGDLNRAEKQLSQRNATIAANTKDIEKLKIDLQRAQATLADTQQDLTGTKNDRDEQARQKKVIATCLDKLTTALGAAAAGNRSAYEKASAGLNKVCEEAEDYL